MTASTTIINNVTTTIPVVAYTTVDYTVTVTASATVTEVVSETQTVTAEAVLAPSKRAQDPLQDDFDMPEYASACVDIFQYSSACDCIGFTPSTSTAPAPLTTSTVTSTVTLPTSVIVSTGETVVVTKTGTPIPVTATVSTIPVSQAVETLTTTTIIATTLRTETSFETVTPVPAPTPTVYLSAGDNNLVENINIPPGAEIGVIVTVRQTTLPAKLSIDPISGTVALIQSPATTVPYSFYYYDRNTAFSYVQLTTERVSNILGVKKLPCRLNAAKTLVCTNQGSPVEFWLCGRHLAVIFNGQSQTFINSCVNGARTVTLEGIAI